MGMMSNADSSTNTRDTESSVDDEFARINMRIPQQKYDWLQEELDSFTSDTGRFQYLIQFYSDHKVNEIDYD